jgi:glutamyl/glutaminyl-tRNA synthetase
MSTEQRQFTDSREIASGAAHEAYDESLDKRIGIPFEQFLEYFDYGWWRDARLRWRLAAAREHDRDSRTRLVLQWNSISGFDMAHFEWTGRQFVRQLAVDNLAQLVGAPRGGVLRAKPNEELRREIALFKRVQAAREAAFRFTGKGEYGGKDVPARLGLGGLQDFTAGA